MNELEYFNQLNSLVASITAVLNMKEDFLSLAQGDKASDKVNFMICLSFDEILQAKKRKVKELLKQIN